EHLIDVGGAVDAESFSVRDLNEFYAQARLLYDSDPAFGERCRQRVVLLQGGDPETLRLWKIFVGESLRHIVEVHGALCVFPDGFTNRQGDPLPLIVRKSDGGYGYQATDLASIRDRTARR